MSWGKVKIGDVAEILPGFAFKSSELGDEGTPLIKIGNILNNGQVDTVDVQRLPQTHYLKKHDKYRLGDRDIVIAMTGATAGKVGRIHASLDEVFLLNQRVAKFVPNEIDQDFLWFAIGNEQYRAKFFALGGGAAQPNMSGPQIASVEIPLPDLPTQQRIAGILSAYDDLIENNRRRIGLLEQAARLLYREWFVHLRFPGHETSKIVDGLPEGWERSTLGEVTDLTWGDTNTTKSAYVETGFDAYSASGLDGKLSKFDYDRDGIVLSAIGAQCGKTWLARGKWSCIKNTIRIFPTEDRLGLEYLYFATFGEAFWPRRGAAQPFISQADARRQTILLPNSALMQKFSEFGYAALTQARTLTNEVNALTRARDLLLPRLMDGRIPV